MGACSVIVCYHTCHETRSKKEDIILRLGQLTKKILPVFTVIFVLLLSACAPQMAALLLAVSSNGAGERSGLVSGPAPASIFDDHTRCEQFLP